MQQYWTARDYYYAHKRMAYTRITKHILLGLLILLLLCVGLFVLVFLLEWSHEKEVTSHGSSLQSRGMHTISSSDDVTSKAGPEVKDGDVHIRRESERNLSFWGDWSSWSHCSVSCGAGTMTRDRHMVTIGNGYQDNLILSNQSNHTIITQDIRSCAQWVCPDCNYSCPAGSDLVNSCHYCACPGEVTRGQVLYTEGTMSYPLSGCTIMTQSGFRLGLCDNNGMFTINNVCLHTTNFTVVRLGFVVHTMQYDAAYEEYVVRMMRMEPVTFLEVPQSQYVLRRSNVTLVCRIRGTPIRYEWYKNDLHLSDRGAHTEVLHLHNVQQHHTGYYRCRAYTADDVAVTSPAARVHVAGNIGDACHSVPSAYVIQLPPSCTSYIHNRTTTTVDIGRCPSIKCPQLQTINADITNNYYCGAVRHNSVTVNCLGFTYTMLQTMECGCTKSTTDKTPKNAKSIYIRVLDSHGIDATQAVKFYYKKQPYTVTVGGGMMIMDADRSDEYAILNFSSKNPQYAPTLAVLQLTNDRSNVFDIVLLRKEQSHEISDTSIENYLVYEISKNCSISSRIGANSIVDFEGIPLYGEPVVVHYTFKQYTDIVDISSAPGLFYAMTDYGELNMLLSYGVITLYSDGNTRITGTVTLDLSLTHCFLTANLSAYILDQNTGYWIKQEITNTLSQSKSPDNLPGSIPIDITSAVTYISLAASPDVLHRCVLAVKVYEDAACTVPAPDVQVFDIYVLSDKKHTVHAHYTATYNPGVSTVACLPVVCGMMHNISIRRNTYDESSDEMVYTVNPQSLPADTSAATNNGTLMMRPEFLDSIDGPVSLAALHSCDRASAAVEFSVVPKSTDDHLYAQELQQDQLLNWYPVTWQNQRTICMMKIGIQLDTSLLPVAVAGTSLWHYGNVSMSFGSFTTSLHESVDDSHELHSACVEVKCAEDAYDASGNVKIIWNQTITVDLAMLAEQHLHCSVLDGGASGISPERTSATAFRFSLQKSNIDDILNREHGFLMQRRRNVNRQEALNTCSKLESYFMQFICLQPHR